MRQLLRGLVASVALILPASAAILIVDPGGGGNFLDIQSAVDAAVDGDTILVRTGTYGAVVVDGKGLTIQADVGAIVQIQGSLQVLNTQPTQINVVDGIKTAGLVGSSVPVAEGVGFRVDSCLGPVTARDCEFTGAKGTGGGVTCCTEGKVGLSGVLLSNSSSVALIGCLVLAGKGGEVNYPNWNPAGGDGGIGIEATNSTVALCEVLATGGKGGEAGNWPGTGGDALHAKGSLCAIQSVNGTYTGGNGGVAWDFVASAAGDGGDAIHAHNQANVKSFGDALFRGAGGACLVLCQNGKPGKQVNTAGSGLNGGGVVKLLGPYCTAGVSASGCLASIGSNGTPSASEPSGFFLAATGVEGQKQGQFFFSTNGKALNAWGNSNGFNCVGAPVRRGALLGGNGTTGSCDGAFSYDLNAHWTQKPAHNPGSGSLVQAQLWYRDPLSTSNQDSALSDALEFPVCP